MANQNNFQTDLSLSEASNTRFTVSRIVENLSDDILTAELPTVFPSVLDDISVEISIYSLFDNALVYYGVAQNTDKFTPISINTFTYSDNTIRTLLYINFAELPNFFLPTGKYQVTFNIFSGVIGSYDNKILRVTKISPSRREVELENTKPTLQNISKIKSYVEPAISSDWIYVTIQQIYNQIGADTQYIPASNVGMTTASVLLTLDPSSSLSTYKFDTDSIDGKPGVNTLTKQVLNKAYLITTQSLVQDISRGTSSFTANQLYGYVTKSLRTAYNELLTDESTNPTKYRFDLL